jgi:RsiW-degrading membrane proteinase PrsW (M82 family)
MSPAAPEADGRPAPTAADGERRVGRRAWLWVLLTGTAVLLAACAITALTRDTILVPTVILVGTFVVPVAMVTLALSRSSQPDLPAHTLLLAFVAAGTLGVVGSALIETYALPSAYGTFAGVGLIEEVTKGAVVVVAARFVPSRAPRDGILLGATVGAGFASFESAGYALTAVIGHAHDHPIRRIVETEAFRAVLAPFGHITWTALLGGALFAAASASGRFRLSTNLVRTLIGVVALHGLWDASYGWAIMITQGLVGDGWDLTWPNTQAWIGAPTGSTLVVFQATYDVLLAVWGLIGAAWLVSRWRGYGRLGAARADPAMASAR